MTQATESRGLLPTRRQVLTMIGASAGSSTAYSAMETMGVSTPSNYSGPIKLSGAPKGATVLVLGAGIAGLTAALELRNAGYKVRVIEYQKRPGGRNFSLRGGDVFTELGGAVQKCEFDAGHYINPGPWRIPFHHYGLLDYCKRLGVKLEPFVQVNHNAYVHNTKAFGGKPQRFRHVQTDYFGYVAELLAKVTSQHKLDESITPDEQGLLLESLQRWGALDKNMAYVSSGETSDHRGFDREPGGGLSAAPKISTVIDRSQLLQSDLWRSISAGQDSNHHTGIFQPVGGMDQISKGFAREVGSLITYNAKVVAIQQDAGKVTVTWEDATGGATSGGKRQQATADWCVCTIPLTVLSQIDIQVGQPMRDAIDAVPYSASNKIGLQFKRRFWEEDDRIYGGITYTDLPISQIGYPNYGYHGKKGVILGAYMGGRAGFSFASMSPADRIKEALRQGAAIHPQYAAEFETGMSVAWHRVPWTLGCAGSWTPETRAKHYDNLCAIDGRIVLAGEHASFIPAWQEGALLSSLDAIGRLHRKAVAG